VRVLLDENIPHQLRAHLQPHETATAVFTGFGGFKNGDLLRAAEKAGFDLLVTADLSLEYQQNLTRRKIAIVSLTANSWRILRNNISAIAKAVESSSPGSFQRVECGRYKRESKLPDRDPACISGQQASPRIPAKFHLSSLRIRFILE
jgi:hypothetical protein